MLVVHSLNGHFQFYSTLSVTPRRVRPMDARVQAGRPCELDEIAVVGGVIRMLVGDEDVTQ
jgi:hypothetical protein